MSLDFTVYDESDQLTTTPFADSLEHIRDDSPPDTVRSERNGPLLWPVLVDDCPPTERSNRNYIPPKRTGELILAYVKQGRRVAFRASGVQGLRELSENVVGVLGTTYYDECQGSLEDWMRIL